MNNSSTDLPSLSPSLDAPSLSPFLIVLRTSFIVVIGLLIIAGNILSIAVTRRVSDIADSTKVLMTSLAVYDLLVGFMTLTFMMVASALDRWPFGDLGCQIVSVVSLMAFCMSGYTVLFLNVERYIAVTRPYRFPVWCSRRRVIVLVIKASVLSLTTGIVALFLFGVSTNYTSATALCFYDNNSKLFNTLALFFLDIFPAFLITYIYYHMIKISREHQQRVNRNNPNGAHDTRSNKALKMFLIVTVTLGGCYTPVIVTRVVEAYADVEIPAWLQFLLNWLPICNSTFNVFIYCLFNQLYRQTAKKIIHEQFPHCKRSVAPMDIQH